MRTLFYIMIAITVVFILTGCVLPTKEIARVTTSTRMDVFVEVPAEGNAPTGFVDLVIKASLKTPLDGYHVLESKTPAQEKPSYTFLVNIDGQAALWTGDGQKEAVPLYDENNKTSRDPDAGTGIKYRLEKKIRLAVGLHKIVFALPNQDYLSEFRVSLNEGESQVLEFKPRYRYKTYPFRIPTFLKGIERYEAVLNGQTVPAVVADLGSYGFKVFLRLFN
jgi:hypothetical protein